jgi:hypothetical protein
MFGIFQNTLSAALNVETDTQNNKHHDVFLELANHLLHTSQKLADIVCARTTDEQNK